MKKILCFAPLAMTSFGKLVMTAVLFAALIFIQAESVKAQSTYSVPTSGTKTITAADTLYHRNVPSKIRAFQYTYTETSGTTAGKVYLEGSVDTVAYVLIDSLTLADAAGAQTKIVTIAATAGTSYRYYRWRNTNTSSATGTIRGTMLRRFDD